MGCVAPSGLEYPDHVRILRTTHPELAEAVAGFTGASDMLAWMQRAGLASSAVDIVAMDEFEYDFLICLRPDGEWLSFGLT
jgi:hypothetical protein